MSKRANLDKLKQRAGRGPILPDTVLYRALSLVAGAIAKRLTSHPADDAHKPSSTPTRVKKRKPQ